MVHNRTATPSSCELCVNYMDSLRVFVKSGPPTQNNLIGSNVMQITPPENPPSDHPNPSPSFLSDTK